jgi:hypothetical protein
MFTKKYEWKDTAWHYYWWEWSYRILWLTPPYRPSICPYFWRSVLFAPLFFYPVGIVLRVVAAPVQLIIRFMNWLWHFFPQRPPKPRVWKQPFSEKHPKLARVGRAVDRQFEKVFITLWLLLAGSGLIFVFVKSPISTLIGIGLFGAIFGLVALGCWVFDTPAAHMTADFLRAKKEKYCPFVNIIRTRS